MVCPWFLFTPRREECRRTAYSNPSKQKAALLRVPYSAPTDSVVGFEGNPKEVTRELPLFGLEGTHMQNPCGGQTISRSRVHLGGTWGDEPKMSHQDPGGFTHFPMSFTKYGIRKPYLSLTILRGLQMVGFPSVSLNKGRTFPLKPQENDFL